MKLFLRAFKWGDRPSFSCWPSRTIAVSRRLGWGSAIAIGLATFGTSALLAQTPRSSLKQLPPPPSPLRVPSTPIPSGGSIAPRSMPVEPRRTPVPQVNASPANPVVREYTFQAPQDSPPPVSSTNKPRSLPSANVKKPSAAASASKPVNRPAVSSTTFPTTPAATTANLYRVEVEGTDETLLAQVQSVEPFAAVWPSQGIIYGGLFPQQQQAQERARQFQQKGLTAKIVPISRDGSVSRVRY